jgi:engulfment/cell motility protein 1
MLINSLLSHANDARWEEFIAELERLNVRRAVIVCSHLSAGLNAVLMYPS